MKEKKKFSPLWLIPAVVVIALILWCIRFPLTGIAGFSKNVEPLHATVFFDQVPETPAITYATDDPDQLSELAEQLRSVRGRFMGWFTSITYNEDPLLHLIVVGTKGNKEYSLSLSADSDGYIYIQRKHTQLRTKDAALYDYLTELAARHDGVVTLNNGWNYTPQDDMRYTVRSAILGEGEKEYCRSVEFHYAIQDSDAKQWAVEQYTDFYEGWTEDYLKANMAAVRASYTVEYDGTKTPLPSGKIERVFLMFINKETGKWEIWESATAAPVEDTEEQPPAVPEITVDPSLYEQAQTQVFSFGDTLSVQVSNVIKTEKRVLPAEDNFEYEVYTVLPGAEIEVMHAAVEDTVELGPLGIWKVYSKDGNKQYIEPNMENIPITENTNGIGAESVCVLVFELYTGEDAAA